MKYQWNMYLWIVVGAGLVIIITLLWTYGDLLGVRLIRKGLRQVVVQGEQVTLEFAASSRIRKLEMCTDERKYVLGYSDFSDCRTLKLSVPAGVIQADVTIPANFPPGRAVVIMRQRGANGKLLAVTPGDTKIALLVKKAQSGAAAPGGGSGGGGGGGSSGGSGGSGEGGSGSSSTTQANHSPPLSNSATSDGRTITISGNHSKLIAGQTERFMITYTINNLDGAYAGEMEGIIESPDVSNISPPAAERRDWDQEGRTYLVWSYQNVPNGGSVSFSFDVKVPPKGFRNRDTLKITGQMHDTYGPRPNYNGAPGPLNVYRGNSVVLPIR